eukprot:tig00000792_g4221.t1
MRRSWCQHERIRTALRMRIALGLLPCLVISCAFACARVDGAALASGPLDVGLDLAAAGTLGRAGNLQLQLDREALAPASPSGREPSLTTALNDTISERARAAEDIAAFLHWFRSNGGRLHPALVIRAEGEGSSRGVFAKAPIQAGEELFHVPGGLMLNCDPDEVRAMRLPGTLAMAPPPGRSSGPFEAGLACAAVRLLRESLDNSSFWAPYIRVLPRSLEVPLLEWTLEEVALLADGDPAAAAARLEAARAARAVAAELEADLPRLAPGAGGEGLGWALRVAATRAWETCAFLAFDLANHHPDTGADVEFPGTAHAGARGFRETCAAASARATAPLAPGSQAHAFYGERTGAALLLHYGYLPPLRDDVVELALLLPGPRRPAWTRIDLADGDPGDDASVRVHVPTLRRAMAAKGFGPEGGGEASGGWEFRVGHFLRHGDGPGELEGLLDLHRAIAGAGREEGAGPMRGPGAGGPEGEAAALGLLRATLAARLAAARAAESDLAPASTSSSGAEGVEGRRAGAAGRMRAQARAILQSALEVVEGLMRTRTGGEPAGEI